MVRIFAFITLLAITAIWLLDNHSQVELKHEFQVGDILGGIPDTGFQRAMAPRRFNFPDDHGPHPAFRNEWWYFTGNLTDTESNRFGFQLVFFRNALSPKNPERTSAWGSNQTWMAHLALTNVSGKKFYSFERFSRGAKELAGAKAKPFQVWLYDWSITESNGHWHLHAKADNIGLDLKLKPIRQPLLQGQDGLSQKSNEPGNASYYYSIPRLAAGGEIKLDNKIHQVTGLSWLDREWSTSALGENQAGWDWFSLQLSDGSDLMFYRLRSKDGTADPHSSGTLLQKDGEIIRLNADAVQLQELEWWDSPAGGSYPIRWKLEIPEQDIELTVSPALKNQELDLLIRYWEGAVEVSGKKSGKQLKGHGYLELAGYAKKSNAE